MAEGSLSPAYVVLNYHSAYGTHKATIPTKEWFPTSITGDLGSYENWDGLPVDAEEMITAYCTAVMEFYPSTAGFDTAEIWTKADATSPAYPRKTKNLAIVGTNAAAVWSKAVQHQWIFRGADFSIMKLVMLDVLQQSGWDALTDISGSPDALAVYDEITGGGNAWSTRKNAQPITFMKITYKLNDKLRSEYEMD